MSKAEPQTLVLVIKAWGETAEAVTKPVSCRHKKDKSEFSQMLEFRAMLSLMVSKNKGQ